MKEEILYVKIKSYWTLLKPRQTLLLTYSGFCSMMATKCIPTFSSLIMALSALFLSIAGATILTNYVDRDIDALMKRTRHRSLPSKKIDPPSKALYFGLILLAISIPLAFYINIFFLAFLIWGVINSVLVYNILAKRKTPWNILIASPTGATPILGGWVAIKDLSIEPILISIAIILWIPIHVWSVVLKWREDYIMAKIPMMPLKIKHGERIIAIFCFILSIYISYISYLLKFHINLTYILLILNIIIIALSLNLFIRRTEENAWLLFKFTSPYIMLFLTIWVLNKYCGG